MKVEEREDDIAQLEEISKNAICARNSVLDEMIRSD